MSQITFLPAGDFIIETSAGGSLTGSSSGVSGAGGNILILQQSASYLSIGGSMTLTGGESGNVHGAFIHSLTLGLLAVPDQSLSLL